jgi:hypothetical protein
MKKVTLLCGMLLALVATVASAAPGTNLRWDLCFGDGGPINKNFACATNGGAQQLVGSFELPAAGLAQVSGLEIVVDIATAGSTLPAWWQFKNVGTCRAASLGMTGAIGTLGPNCIDWSQGAPAGGLAAYTVGIAGPNTARIIGGIAQGLPLSDLSGGQEYFGYIVSINNAKTVGTGSCAGCNVAACIINNSIKCATPPVAGTPSRDITLVGATNATDSNFSTWQGGGGVSVGGKNGCPLAVPTHKTTWQQVKTLYR